MRILWLKSELLHPVDKGGKIRTYYMLKELKKNHHVTYLTLDDGDAAPDAAELASEYCHDLVTIPFRAREKFTTGFFVELAANLLSPLPYPMAKYRSEAMREAIAAQFRRQRYDVLVCDFLTPSINMPAVVPCATVLFQHNVEAMIWKRHYQVQKHPVKRAYLYEQWRKEVRYEKATCRQFDQVVAVSEDDAEVMRAEYGIETVASVATGVDTDYFRPSGAERVEPRSLVFTGSMDWLPNDDAIRYFTSEILPRIRRSVPDVKLTVVGRNPLPGLVELAERDPSIVVTGRVDDVRPYMERAAAYVIPLRIGGGTRLKVYEAMAMEKAIISTSIGAEGLPVRHGSDILLADSPDTFADSVVDALTDPTLSGRLGQNAARLVRERFGWSGVADEFAGLCEQAIGRARARRVARVPMTAAAR